MKNSVINSSRLRKIQRNKTVSEGSAKKFILMSKDGGTPSIIHVGTDLWIWFKILINPDNPEIECLKQMIFLLKPFECVTKESSGQDYVRMMNCLR